jgi:hypothetical protein
MQPEQIQKNFALFLMLIICSSVVYINTYEIYKLTKQWNKFSYLNSNYFKICIKPEFIVKLFFSFYSFLGSFSALLLSLCLLINFNFFINKLMSSYLKFVYYIYGPCMFICCILGLFNWNESCFICEEDENNKVFYFQNAIYIIILTLISLIITLSIEFCRVMGLYSDTIMNNSDGSKFLSSIFWGICLKLNRNQRNNNLLNYLNNNNNSMN